MALSLRMFSCGIQSVTSRGKRGRIENLTRLCRHSIPHWFQKQKNVNNRKLFVSAGCIRVRENIYYSYYGFGGFKFSFLFPWVEKAETPPQIRRKNADERWTKQNYRVTSTRFVYTWIRVCGISRNLCINAGLERNRNKPTVMRRFREKKICEMYECLRRFWNKARRRIEAKIVTVFFINFFSSIQIHLFPGLGDTGRRRWDFDAKSDPVRMPWRCIAAKKIKKKNRPSVRSRYVRHSFVPARRPRLSHVEKAPPI